MPGKLTIQNASNSTTVNISLWSIDGKIQHISNSKLAPKESTNLIVKGGVKKLAVSINNQLKWSGMIPSYGSSPVTIYPDDTVSVIYRDTKMVNTMNSANSGMNIPIHTWIIAFVLIIIALSYYLYTRSGKRKR